MYRIDRVETEAELNQLKAEWKGLLTRTQHVAIFLTWEWITTWWNHFGKGRELFVLTARDQHGRLAGIAPWMLEQAGKKPMSVRKLAFIGTGMIKPSHLDLIASSDEGQAIGVAFLNYLKQHSQAWDLIDLVSLVSDSPLRSILIQNNESAKEGQRDICTYIPLPGNWETYRSEFLSSSLRRNVKFYRQRLERDFPGQVLFTCVVEPEQVMPAFQAIKAMQQKRLAEQGFQSPFEESSFMAFHLEIAGKALEQDWLRLYLLKVGEDLIAVNYTFEFQGRFYGYQMAFDDAWAKYSPGMLILVHAIKEGIRLGLEEYDLLLGDQSYKARWSDYTREDIHILLGHSLKGMLWQEQRLMFDKLVMLGRKFLPYRVRRVGNAWLSSLGR